MNPSQEQVGDLLRESLDIEVDVTEPSPDLHVEGEDEVEETLEEEAEELVSESETEEEVEEEVAIEGFLLSDLAPAFGDDVDPSELYSISVPMPDGKEAVSIGQLKDAYLSTSQVSATAEELEQEREAFKQQVAQTQQQLQQKAQVSEKQIELQSMLYALDQEEQSIDWEKAAAEMPGEAALRKQELADARQKITGALQHQQQEDAQQSLASKQQYTQYHVQEMLKATPEWRDEKVRTQEYTQIADMMQKEYGLKPQEVGAIIDHRYMRIARDLMKYKAAEAGADGLKESLNKMPRKLRGRGVSKIGNPAAAKASKVKKLSEITNRGKKAKDPRSKAQAVSDLLNL